MCVLYEAGITRRIANYCNFSIELKCVLQAFPDIATQYVRYGYKRVLWKTTRYCLLTLVASVYLRIISVADTSVCSVRMICNSRMRKEPWGLLAGKLVDVEV